jgi:aminoglycoside phosphotransferase (APT) family kinase protein
VIEQLAAFLSARIGAPVRVANLARKSGGGSRETWLFDAEWLEDGKTHRRSLVLRRDPTASLLDSDREREFRLLECLQGSDIPVPRVEWFERSSDWLERPFFVMERAPGAPTPPTFPSVSDVAQREQAARDFVAILARIHRLDWAALGLEFLPGVEARPPAEVQVETWRQVYAQERQAHEPLIEVAFQRLLRTLPATDRVTLVHGDFRSGNYLLDDAGRITAMLDWEMAHLGDPMEDLGWACMKFWSGGGRVCGLLERREFLRRYEDTSGIAVDATRVAFYELLGNIKMAIICMTGMRSFAEGRSSDAVLGLVGLMIPRLLDDIAVQLGMTPGENAKRITAGK